MPFSGLHLVYLAFVAVSFIASLSVFFRKGTPFYLQIFPLFLFLTFVDGIISQLLIRKFNNNHVLHNIYTWIAVPFYLYILREVINNRVAKKRCLHSIYLFLLVAGVVSWLNGIQTFNTEVYLTGAFFITLFCGYYFYELISKERQDKLVNLPTFWICSAILFFYGTTLPLFASVRFASYFPVIILEKMGLFIYLVNYAFYSLFTIGFLVRLAGRKQDIYIV